jgi:hypothetical protein
LDTKDKTKKPSKWRKKQEKKYRKKINLKPAIFLLIAAFAVAAAFYVHRSGFLNAVFVASPADDNSDFDASDFVRIKPLPQIDFEELEK